MLVEEGSQLPDTNTGHVVTITAKKSWSQEEWGLAMYRGDHLRCRAAGVK